MTNTIVKSDLDLAVAASLVTEGDISGLTHEQRAAYYLRTCEGLGLNPASQPFAFLRLNGKEVMYAKRGATDQLAAIHRVVREIIEGPKVIDLAGTKIVYCVARASLPGGRCETAIATLPLVDPAMVLMKAETKAKRRATLALLGLAMLDEQEVADIPAGERAPSRIDVGRVNAPPRQLDPGPAAGDGVPGDFTSALADAAGLGDLARLWQRECRSIHGSDAAEPAWAAVADWLHARGYDLVGTEQTQLCAGNWPSHLTDYLDALAVCSDAESARTHYRAHRDAIAAWDTLHREAARLVTVRSVMRLRTCSMNDAKRYLAEGGPTGPTGTDGSDGPSRGAEPGGANAANDPIPEAAASRASVAEKGGPVAYLATKGSRPALENAVRAHGRHVTGLVDAAAARLDALTPPDAHGARVTQETLRKVVESWAAEGPRSRARKVEPRTEAA